MIASSLLSRFLPGLLVLTLALTHVCRGQEPEAKATGNSPLAPATPLSPDDYYKVNCSARGLAGVKSPTDRGEITWESTAAWREYSQYLDERWAYLDRVRLNAMTAWGNTELGDLRSKTSNVYYPFSGPDVLYADTLFPNSKILLMAGLEPVGKMPDLAELQAEGKLPGYLNEVKTSLVTILTASFFKTKDMKNDFNNQLVDGLTPAIAVFLARQGYTIDSLQYVTLDGEGQVHPEGQKSGAPGVQIAYFKGDRSDTRVLLYFQTDLGNDGLKSNPGYVRIMSRLGAGVTYLKAASYLMYENYFSTIRDAILNDSVGVVEDDSGIPFHFFKLDQWDVIPYGNYTGPIGLFHERGQPDLTAYYAKTPHQPLSFGSGYKYTASVSSLLVAKKK